MILTSPTFHILADRIGKRAVGLGLSPIVANTR